LSVPEFAVALVVQEYISRSRFPYDCWALCGCENFNFVK